MMSPGYLLDVQPTTRNAISPSLSEGSIQSSASDGMSSNILLYHQPYNYSVQCYQSIMPPPPHNILSTINNNNTHSKNYNRCNSWNNNQRKSTKDTKNSKQNIKSEKEKEKQENEQQTCLRLSSVDKKMTNFLSNVEIIWAKVPILKFQDHVRNLNIDLNCNNSVGIRNTHLLHCYANLDWRVRPLVLVVKLWARSNNINNAKNMTISSYSLALMVIHFLQCGVTPPVIPCLHGLYPGKFHAESDIHSIDMWEQLNPFLSDNHQTLGELLNGFLHYYCRFEYNLYAISVRLGARIPIDECRMAKSSRNDPHQWKLLCIEEPFDLTNTARSVYDVDAFENIKTVFRNSYTKLHATRDLFSIFKQNDAIR